LFFEITPVTGHRSLVTEAMAQITLVEAINLALAREMERDPGVVVLGEDVGVDGGVFRATLGLTGRFGPERVIDTPLAEALIVGMTIGMAVEGLKPVAEIQFSGFAYTAIDQIINHAGRMRHRTRGRLSCPMVLRTPCGAGIHAPEHHSESPEAMFAHIPGIRVICPSSPRRAYGLLLAAIRDPDPVVFLEPTRLYRLFKEEVADNGEALALDTCFTLREGSDLTFVTWGPMVPETLAAADELAEQGISAEVVDVAQPEVRREARAAWYMRDCSTSGARVDVWTGGFAFLGARARGGEIALAMVLRRSLNTVEPQPDVARVRQASRDLGSGVLVRDLGAITIA